jgi:hypothetical protein
MEANRRAKSVDKNGIFVVLVVLAVIFLLARIGYCRTITVRADGSGEYPTIQAAIWAAAGGDEVVLETGTYTGAGNRDIDFLGKAITVRGIDPFDISVVGATIIDCNGSEANLHRGFKFHSAEGPGSCVSGVTVVNGYGPIDILGTGVFSAGGAIYFHKSSPTIENCILAENSASFGGAVGGSNNSNPTLLNCALVDNSSHNRGGAIYAVRSCKLVVSQCTIAGNSASIQAGGMYTESNCQVQVANSVFSRNSARFRGALTESGGTGTIRDCIFTANTAELWGGALGTDISTVTFINCLFTGNVAGEKGGAVDINYGTEPRFISCTFAGNSAPFGNAFACDSWEQRHPSTVELAGCILWNGADEIWNNDNSIITISYSDVQGGWLGLGNIDGDPCFVEAGFWDANGVWVEGDYHLLDDSPCIDTGDPNYIAEPNETDLDGNPRVSGGRIDMGAYEAMVINVPPVACIVGDERVVEAGVGCEAQVVLDGSCSSDADSTEGTNDDINDFDWYDVIDVCDPNSDIYIGSGEVIECNLGLGEHLIILEVTDKAGAFDSNEVVITVEDVTPPEFSLVVEPNVLWPPNGKMVQVRPEWEVSDNCDEEVEVSLVDISMSAAGDINDYVVIGDDGSIYLRARKSKVGSGRIYTLTYEAVDDSGNVTEASTTVAVRHRRGPRRVVRGLVRRAGRKVHRRALRRREATK